MRDISNFFNLSYSASRKVLIDLIGKKREYRNNDVKYGIRGEARINIPRGKQQVLGTNKLQIFL